ncbi:MAG: ABC transporter ATP-binding protein [Herpetosiphonaceae bacterium]|nr:ABC transporter ATP-binding protein [Herpetosiphonaceae bacterium]
MRSPPLPASPLLTVEHLTYGYGRDAVLHDVSFQAEQGTIVSLLGPSGCGKSTLLRVIVGLETPYGGTVRFAGRPLEGVPVHQRGFGLMFQEFALFPHRSVAENVAFGLRMQRLAPPIIAERVRETLALVGLPAYGNRTIWELSGGERQRVALARSLAPQPKLLLLDEPLGALDRTLREQLTDELHTIIKRIGLTSIYVTHDQAEAFAVADRVVLMNAGRIVQSGSPAEVYAAPTTLFAARFLGFDNILQGVVECSGALTVVRTAIGCLRVKTSSVLSPDSNVAVVIRPEAAVLVSEDGRSNDDMLEATVIRSTFRGATERVVVRHRSGTELVLDLAPGQQPGTMLQLALRPEALTLIGEH